MAYGPGWNGPRQIAFFWMPSRCTPDSFELAKTARKTKSRAVKRDLQTGVRWRFWAAGAWGSVYWLSRAVCSTSKRELSPLMGSKPGVNPWTRKDQSLTHSSTQSMEDKYKYSEFYCMSDLKYPQQEINFDTHTHAPWLCNVGFLKLLLCWLRIVSRHHLTQESPSKKSSSYAT